MGQQNTANNRKGPPKFQHLPKTRAKRLKSAWIHTRKIKSKWKAEKRREGIQSPATRPTVPELETPVSNARVALGQKPDHYRLDLTEIDAGSDEPPSRTERQPVTIREPNRTTKTGLSVGSSLQKDHRHRSGRRDHQWRHPSRNQGKKPSMKSRMNVLLEKIQREID